MNLDIIYNEITNLGKSDNATLSEDVCKLIEEVGELVQEINKVTGRKKFDGDIKKVNENIKEEIADTLQNLLLICSKFDIDMISLLNEVSIKNKKWEKILKEKNDIHTI
jgi:NTP pyrophosphatase (non-canonical NTP hydrolase)